MSSNVRPESMERISTPELANKFIEEQVAAVREQVGDKRVLLALSGSHTLSAASTAPTDSGEFPERPKLIRRVGFVRDKYASGVATISVVP